MPKRFLPLPLPCLHTNLRLLYHAPGVMYLHDISGMPKSKERQILPVHEEFSLGFRKEKALKTKKRGSRLSREPRFIDNVFNSFQ